MSNSEHLQPGPLNYLPTQQNTFPPTAGQLGMLSLSGLASMSLSGAMVPTNFFQKPQTLPAPAPTMQETVQKLTEKIDALEKTVAENLSTPHVIVEKLNAQQHTMDELAKVLARIEQGVSHMIPPPVLVVDDDPISLDRAAKSGPSYYMEF